MPHTHDGCSMVHTTDAGVLIIILCATDILILAYKAVLVDWLLVEFEN